MIIKIRKEKWHKLVSVEILTYGNGAYREKYNVYPIIIQLPYFKIDEYGEIYFIYCS